MIIQLGRILGLNSRLTNNYFNLDVSTLNRHGLITGATGTGKTKTMQVLVEQLSLAGVPSLVIDFKGDISGLALPGAASPMVITRSQAQNISFTPHAFPVELLTLNDTLPGIPVRATISGFGALLFSRLLGLNETQQEILTVIFDYAKSRNLGLISIDDLKTLLRTLQTAPGKASIAEQYGNISDSSIGTMLRKTIALGIELGPHFFCEPAFNVLDLIQHDKQAQGIISVLRLGNMQDSLNIFSSFMLKLLTDVYRFLPEVGDLTQPKLMLFIDEAHLLFSGASNALLLLVERTVKLIRSKGVGLIFCTQTPNDIPAPILNQLGLKIQHALRAFTAKDRQNIKLMAQNFPPSVLYDVPTLLTSLNIGEALVTALDDKGQPTPLAHCSIRVPQSRMGTINEAEINHVLAQSQLLSRYLKPEKTQLTASILNDTPFNYRLNMTKLLKNILDNKLVQQLIRTLFKKIITLAFSNGKNNKR